MTILDEILARKRQEVAERKMAQPEAALARQLDASPTPRPFTRKMQDTVAAGKSAVIAEVKKASPSKGVIRADFDPVAIARSYAASGACCLSVLTDEHFFQGSDKYLTEIHRAVSLPVLRKDFIVDPYQLLEARLLGADCILLIASALDQPVLEKLYARAAELELDALIEVHDEQELARALALEPALIGINNRNLKTFETNLDTTLKLKELIPDSVLAVTESGIHTRDDVARMRDAGVHAFLVGEAFMRADDPGAALHALFG